MAKTGKAYSKQSVKKTGRERKEKLVAELVEKLDGANGLVFTEYKGITHQQLETLRRELKAADATLLIAKNSLMRLSLGKSKNFADYKDNEALVGSAATLFIGNDSVEPLKKLQKSIKDTGLPTIKFGVLEGQLLDEAGVIKLATLPSREVLLAQFVGMLNSPIQRFVTGLNAIPQKFVMTLDAIASAKQNANPAEAQADKPADKAEDEVSTEMQNADSASIPTPEPTLSPAETPGDKQAVEEPTESEPTSETETPSTEEPTNEIADETQNDIQNNEGGENENNKS